MSQVPMAPEIATACDKPGGAPPPKSQYNLEKAAKGGLEALPKTAG